MHGIPGDPSSCSQLGGVLRQQAARLVAERAALEGPLAALRRGTSTDPELASVAARAAADLGLFETVVDRLDETGAALQRYAQELAEVSEERRRLDASARAVGLALEGLRVVEPWGLSSTDAVADRQSALPELQMRADRLASQLGRARAAVQRTTREATGVLGRAAAERRRATGT